MSQAENSQARSQGDSLKLRPHDRSLRISIKLEETETYQAESLNASEAKVGEIDKLSPARENIVQRANKVVRRSATRRPLTLTSVFRLKTNWSGADLLAYNRGRSRRG